VSDAGTNDYRGPSKDLYHDALADYEEARFNVMRATSIAGKVLADWERRGGVKNDIRDGYALRQMTPEEQQVELRRQWRVASWMGMISEDATGQKSFAKLFDIKTPAKTGIGGAILGSRLSVGRAMTAGYNDAKQRNGPTMQEGLEPYLKEFGWAKDSEEALAYCEGFGDGLKVRPPPKAPKEPSPETLSKKIEKELAAKEKAEAAAKKNGAPGGRKQAALPAPDAPPAPEAGFDDGEQTGPIH
jgi:hypothetical protein